MLQNPNLVLQSDQNIYVNAGFTAIVCKKQILRRFMSAVEKAITKFKTSLWSGSEYEAQQFVKTVYHRLRSRKCFEDSRDLLKQAACAQFDKDEVALHQPAVHSTMLKRTPWYSLGILQSTMQSWLVFNLVPHCCQCSQTLRGESSRQCVTVQVTCGTELAILLLEAYKDDNLKADQASIDRLLAILISFEKTAYSPAEYSSVAKAGLKWLAATDSHEASEALKKVHGHLGKYLYRTKELAKLNVASAHLARAEDCAGLTAIVKEASRVTFHGPCQSC